MLGVFHCPWTDEEFDGARRRILGLDFSQLAGVVDAFSPMVYHGRMGRPPEWVGEYVTWLSKQIPARRNGLPAIWPIVQADDEPGGVSPAEFEKVMTLGVSGRAGGIMMFTIRSVAGHDGKMEALKKLYRRWASSGAPTAGPDSEIEHR